MNEKDQMSGRIKSARLAMKQPNGRKMSIEEVANRLGISKGSISHWEKGANEPSGRNLAKLADVLGVSQHWLLYGEEKKHTDAQMYGGGISVWENGDAPESDEVDVPFFGEVELSAGSGTTAVAEIRKAPIRFHRQTLRSADVTPGAAACCRISGDSMEPILPDGATVGINTHETAIVDGKMYAVEHGGLLRVKILQRLPGRKVLLRSANPSYGDEEVEMGEGFRVLGRVFWSSAVWR